MFSLFPSLFTYGQLSPFIIRVVLGAVLLYWAYKVLRGSNASSKIRALGIVEGLAGLLLVIGLWSQAAALFVLINLLVRIVYKIQQKSFLTNGVNYYLILLVLSASILLTGAGAFAFDLPL